MRCAKCGALISEYTIPTNIAGEDFFLCERCYDDEALIGGW